MWRLQDSRNERVTVGSSSFKSANIKVRQTVVMHSDVCLSEISFPFLIFCAIKLLEEKPMGGKREAE